MTETFTPVASLLGGAIVGLAASLLLLTQGRIAGISGILGGVVVPRPGEVGWRAAFLAGLVASGAVAVAVAPEALATTIQRSPSAMVVAGLLVGFGTRLGSGCTSGHGVCGLSRLSVRSLVAVLTFMLTGALTVAVVNHLFGGAV